MRCESLYGLYPTQDSSRNSGSTVLALRLLLLHGMRHCSGFIECRLAEREDIDDFLNNVILPTVDFLPYDDEAARWHAVARARLEREGCPSHLRMG